MPHGLTTAPVNPSPRWPSGYIEALREMGAQEKVIPFCIRWVRGFFAQHLGRRRRDLGRTEVEAFLRKVAARPDVTNWPVQQSRDSLELYYEQFRGIALDPRPDIPVTHTSPPVPAQASPPVPPVPKPLAADAPRSPSPMVQKSRVGYGGSARGVKTNAPRQRKLGASAIGPPPGNMGNPG